MTAYSSRRYETLDAVRMGDGADIHRRMAVRCAPVDRGILRTRSNSHHQQMVGKPPSRRLKKPPGVGVPGGEVPARDLSAQTGDSSK
jgi:hypothetical protein